MRCLVTGSTGMLGTSLCQFLLERGHEVFGLTRGKSPRPPMKGEKALRGDLARPDDIRQAVDAARPEVIFHTAALSDVDHCETFPDEAYEVNGKASRHVAEAAAACGAVLFYISSDYVFDGEKKAPYREEDACHPINVYGKSKLLGEEYVRSSCKKHFIIRTSWLFGENRDSFVHHVLEWAGTRKEIPLVKDKWSIPTYTVDLAASLFLLLEKKVPFGVYHLTGGGDGCSWFEYGKQILAGRSRNNVTVVPISLATLKRPAQRPPQTVLHIGKFVSAAGQEPRPWQEALKEYLALVTVPQNPS